MWSDFPAFQIQLRQILLCRWKPSPPKAQCRQSFYVLSARYSLPEGPVVQSLLPPLRRRRRPMLRHLRVLLIRIEKPSLRGRSSIHATAHATAHAAPSSRFSLIVGYSHVCPFLANLDHLRQYDQRCLNLSSGSFHVALAHRSVA